MKEATDTKKTYETPELVTYGDVRVLTANVGNGGRYDTGGAGNTQKTV